MSNRKKPIVKQKSVLGRMLRRVRSGVAGLRKSAIEPLPSVSPLPWNLQQLNWEWGDRDDPSGTVRAGSKRLVPGAADGAVHNDLGCAYAILAWQESADEHWLKSLEHLRDAVSGADKDDLRRTRMKNLRCVVAESGFERCA